MPSKASAVRRPVPLSWKPRALPWAQPGRLTTAWTREEMSGVCCAAVLAPTVFQAGGFQATDAVVAGRLLTLLLVPTYVGVLSAASARRVRAAASVLTSSVWNWIQAREIVAPAGTWRLAKRTPTRWTLVPSVTSSRSVLARSIPPEGPCSASSEPVWTMVSTVATPPPLAGRTVTVTSSPPVAWPSEALSRST